MLSKIPALYDEHPTWNLFKQFTIFSYTVDGLYNKIPDKTILKSDHVVGVVNADGTDLVARGPGNKYANVYKDGTTHNPFGKDRWAYMFALYADKEVRPIPIREIKIHPIGNVTGGHDVDDQVHND
jgi:hypothetical protein